MNDNDKEEETWETMENYSGHRELFSVGSGPINKAKNLTSLNHTVLNSVFIFRHDRTQC